MACAGYWSNEKMKVISAHFTTNNPICIELYFLTASQRTSAVPLVGQIPLCVCMRAYCDFVEPQNRTGKKKSFLTQAVVTSPQVQKKP